MAKISFILNSVPKYRTGGAELQGELIGKELKKYGWIVDFLLQYSPLEFEEIDGIKYYKIKYFGLDNILGYFLKFLTGATFLIIKLNQINPDIVYARSQGINLTTTTSYCKLFNKKLVYHVSSDDDVKPFNKRINFFTSSKNRVIRRIVYYLKQWGIKKADLIIVQNNFQKKSLKENFGLDAVLVPSGHKVPKKLSGKETPPLISWIASFKGLRNPELFIKLAKDCSDLNCKFIMAGDSSRYEKKESCIREIETIKNLEYLGEITIDEAEDLISKSSIFVNTSDYEGFPNTFIQSWIRGTPVVSLRVDPDGLIEENSFGLVSGTYEQLEADVRYLIENGGIREKFGKNAKEYSIKHFDIKKSSKFMRSCIDLC